MPIISADTRSHRQNYSLARPQGLLPTVVAARLISLTSSRLQDEMEELRSEMLEMRDMYMEDDVYQLQELRQQLEQVRAKGRAACTSSKSQAEGKCFATKH